jgi:hypothetical protein
VTPTNDLETQPSLDELHASYVEMPWRQNGQAHPSVYYPGALNRRLRIEWAFDHHQRSGHVTAEAAIDCAKRELQRRK